MRRTFLFTSCTLITLLCAGCNGETTETQPEEQGLIQAPEPGKNVEVVPARLGSEFAGAIRVSPVQAASVAGHVA